MGKVEMGEDGTGIVHFWGWGLVIGDGWKLRERKGLRFSHLFVLWGWSQRTTHHRASKSTGRLDLERILKTATRSIPGLLDRNMEEIHSLKEILGTEMHLAGSLPPVPILFF